MDLIVLIVTRMDQEEGGSLVGEVRMVHTLSQPPIDWLSFLKYKELETGAGRCLW